MVTLLVNASKPWGQMSLMWAWLMTNPKLWQQGNASLQKMWIWWSVMSPPIPQAAKSFRPYNVSIAPCLFSTCNPPHSLTTQTPTPVSGWPIAKPAVFPKLPTPLTAVASNFTPSRGYWALKHKPKAHWPMKSLRIILLQKMRGPKLNNGFKPRKPCAPFKKAASVFSGTPTPACSTCIATSPNTRAFWAHTLKYSKWMTCKSVSMPSHHKRSTPFAIKPPTCSPLAKTAPATHWPKSPTPNH